jgi:hypothetical protein
MKTSERQEWVYVGERTDRKGKRYYAYVDVTAAPRDAEGASLAWAPEDEHWFKKRLGNLGPVGRLFKLDAELTDEGGLGVSNIETAGFWPDIDDTIEWQAKSDAIRSARAAANKEKAESRKNLMHERLEPIRMAYRRASAQERQQILAAVIYYVTGS